MSGTNVGISIAAAKYITSSRATVFNFDKTTKYRMSSSSSKVANELHLVETTPSGRTLTYLEMHWKWEV